MGCGITSLHFVHWRRCKIERQNLNHWTARSAILMRFPTRVHTVHKRGTRPATEHGKEMFEHFSNICKWFSPYVVIRIFRILTGIGSTDRMLCASYNSNGSQSVSAVAFGNQCIACHYKLVDMDPLFSLLTKKIVRNCFVVNAEIRSNRL